MISPENFRKDRDQLGFKVLGLPYRYRKQVRMMESGDRVVFYIMKLGAFGATATVTGEFFESNERRWTDEDKMWPSRRPSRPDIVLEDHELLDARGLIGELSFVRRADRWGSYFQGSIMRIPEHDFGLVESAMKEVQDDPEVKSALAQPRTRKRKPKQRRKVLSLRPSKSKWAQAYEARIIDFLVKLGFEDVGGGPDFHIGESSQIDACGGLGNTLFILDCYHPHDDKEKSIRQKIKTQRGEAALVKRALRGDKTYKRYSEVVPCVAIKQTGLKKADRSFASTEPRVLLWDEQFVTYYTRLSKAIGDGARYDLLGEVGLGPGTVGGKRIKVPALRTKLGRKEFFAFYLPAHDLIKIAYVARREKGNEEHYQRLLNTKRIHEQIGPFLLDKRRKPFFANNIIVSFQGKPEFRTRARGSDGLDYGTLTLPDEYRSAWVVDGQHRLYGFTVEGAPSGTLLPVVGIAGMTANEQADLFLTINREQKPVSPNLIWELEADIHPKSDIGVIARTVIRLEQKNPLRGLIEVPGKSSTGSGRPMKLGNLAETIKSRGLLDKQTRNMKARDTNPLWRPRADDRVETAVRAIARFWNVLVGEFPGERDDPKKHFWLTNNGFNVGMRIYERLLVWLGHTPRVAEVKEHLSPLIDYYRRAYQRPDQFKDLRADTLGEAGRTRTAMRFMLQITRKNPEFAPEVAAGADVGNSMKRFERRLAKAVWGEIVEHVDNPKGEASQTMIRDVKRKRIRRVGDYHKVMTIGDTIPLVERHWDPIFQRIFNPRFKSSTYYKVFVSELADVRAEEMHEDHPLDDRRRDFWDLHHRDVDYCLSRWAERMAGDEGDRSRKRAGPEVPQADDLDQVVRVAALVLDGNDSADRIAEIFGLNRRQGLYYCSAAKILGLVASVDGRFRLTTSGEQYLAAPTDDRLRELVLQVRIIAKLLNWAKSAKKIELSEEMISKFIEHNSKLSPATSERRAQSVSAWLIRVGEASRFRSGIRIGTRQEKL